MISKETNTWTPGEISGIVNAGKCYDFYYDEYGWKGMDGGGSLIKVSINYFEDNSYSSGSDWNIVFGHGGNGRGYTIDAKGGLDTVGHEYTHGVVRAMTSLAMRYQNEPGAINEGYADIGQCFHIVLKQREFSR